MTAASAVQRLRGGWPPRLVGVLLIAAGAAALLFTLAHRGGPAHVKPSVLARGVMRPSSSSDDQAILVARNMAPGDSVRGTVAITNNGSGAGELALRQKRRSQQPGAGGGQLFDHLQLEVRRDDRTLVYSGDIGALGAVPAGRFQAHAARTYLFGAALPEDAAGPAADNLFQGAELSVDYQWTTDTSGLVRGISCPYGSLGSVGEDALNGGTRAERLVAKGGDDRVSGGGGTDCLFGGTGDDQLLGGPGKDELRGSYGDDLLVGGGGPDRLRGRAGDDEIRAADGTADIVRCGRGTDSAFVDSHDRPVDCEHVNGG